MALAMSFDPTLCRQQLAVTGLTGTTSYVTVERAESPFVQWVPVRGWSSQPVAASAVTYFDYEFPEGVSYKYRVNEFTSADVLTTITEYTVAGAAFDDVWLKVPAAPFLNRTITVVDRSEMTNRSRSGLMDVVGRTYPVQVGDVRSSVSYTLQLLTQTAAEERDMESTLSTGDVIFLHLPSTTQVIPGGYFSVGDVTRASTLRLSARRVWSLPLTRVAAPGPDVIGSAYTITSVLAEYATVTAMLAGNATISALLQRTGTPSEVIVP